MVEVKAILFVLSTLALYEGDRDEAPAARDARLRQVAVVISEAARDYEEAAALIELGDAESRYARYVMEGRCLDGPRHAQCDRDPRTGRPRAVTPWQVWSWCQEAHRATPGSEEQLRAGAECAARHWRSAKRRCADRNPDALVGAFSGYRGGSCAWGPAVRRAHRAREVEALLKKVVGAT